MRMYRLIGILLTLENKNKITARELASQYETSLRTIYRDLDALCISMNMYSLQSALTDFWNILISATILSPEELKSAVKDTIEGLYKQYQ